MHVYMIQAPSWDSLVWLRGGLDPCMESSVLEIQFCGFLGVLASHPSSLKLGVLWRFPLSSETRPVSGLTTAWWCFWRKHVDRGGAMVDVVVYGH
ncbi:hypothetical protein IGI04_003762 [Brassica rapa subsp. trilocularis]|uniref:Uncharacterized protein n=1 Tax=Brassica rapa subsp. trilocularis TaxID=1813537 RepID=A0ABQ7NZD1_BRACM|nr:hypothetical protein IGI04_003762 [Brassica rapa subsp. trilocularis]